MAPKPPSSDDPTHAPDDPELKKLGAAPMPPIRGCRCKIRAPSSPDERDEDEDEEIELDDDEDDEDLVVFTAREAAGAFATIFGFVKPFLGNYKKPDRLRRLSASSSRRCSTSSCR